MVAGAGERRSGRQGRAGVWCRWWMTTGSGVRKWKEQIQTVLSKTLSKKGRGEMGQ